MQSNRQTSSDLAYSTMALDTCLSLVLPLDSENSAQIHPDIVWITVSFIRCIRKSWYFMRWKVGTWMGPLVKGDFCISTSIFPRSGVGLSHEVHVFP